MIPAAAVEWPHVFAPKWLFRPAGSGPTLQAVDRCCPVVELRQYTLHPGARDALVRIFDEHFVEGQERCGMRIIGQFRDLDDPDRFVWLRGFADMEARTRALEAFYGGPVWSEHRDAANSTMIDHTNVLLLKPLGSDGGFRLPLTLPAPRRGEGERGVVVAVIDHLEGPVTPDMAAAARGDHDVLAQLVTERARNGYPRLPVREDANVLVTFVSCPTTKPYRPGTPPPGVHRREHLRLQPTPRSALPSLPSGERAG